MFRRSNINVSRDFILNPALLLIYKHRFISEDVLGILKKSKIEIKINFLDTNPEDVNKPVMVLIHGNSASKGIFDTQIKYFSKKYRVIAVDLLGHGSSTKLNELENISSSEKDTLCAAFYNLLAMIATVSSLLQSLQVKNAHIVGWSLGGHIAYGIAISNPELVSSIVTIGSPPIRFCREGLKKAFNDWFVNVLVPEWINQPKIYSMDEAKDIGVHMGFSEKEIEIFANAMVVSDPLMRRNLFLELDAYNAEKYAASPLDAEKFVAETDIPLCMVVGEKDAGINLSCMRGNMRNPISSIHVVENASHAVFATHKAEFYQILDGFFTLLNQEKHRNTRTVSLHKLTRT